MKKKKIVLLTIFVLLIIFNLLVLRISLKFDIPYYEISQGILRQGVLLTLDGLTQIYDPAKTKIVKTGPMGYTGREKNDGYKDIENVFKNANGNMEIRIKELENGKIIKSKFDFGYQPSEEPQMEVLRKEYKIDKVIEGAKSEFEAIVILRDWARSQFMQRDFQLAMKNFNALEILHKNLRNRNNEPYQPYRHYDPCNFFPMFYSQILLSMGYQSRLVQISHISGRGTNRESHGMAEVWSNQFKKWVTMDVDQNLHYEKDGVPLNMLEVHNERYEEAPTKIKIVRGVHSAGDFDPNVRIDVAEMIRYHSYIQIVDMRNDWMTNHYFRGHPKRSDRATLFWVDERMPPVFNFKQRTNNVDDFYWTLNRTEIRAKRSKLEEGKIELAFKTFTPNFRNFEILINGSKKIESDESHFEWQVQPGLNRLEVRSVNQYGVPGIESWIEIEKRE